MISLQPINRKIRETLNNKSKAVSRDFDPLELTDVQIQKEYAKSVWTKMFSPVDSTTMRVDSGGKDKDGKIIWELKFDMKPG